MDLKSIFQRKPGRAAAPSADAPGDFVQQARVRARRRLIGAVVLVVIGVIGFPLLFETQPRPIPVDIPIVVPRRDSAPALAMPTARPSRQAAAAPAQRAASDRAASDIEEVVETPAEAGRDVTAAKPTLPEKGESSRSAAQVSSGGTSSPPAGIAAAASSSVEAKRPHAAPDAKVGDKTPTERGGRFVVQVGAFADSASASEVRQKVERLGLRTYTQVAETANGHRVRVRVGPFATREDADRALAKIKASGAPAVVITL